MTVHDAPGICLTFWSRRHRHVFPDPLHDANVQADYYAHHDCELALTHEGDHRCRCGNGLDREDG